MSDEYGHPGIDLHVATERYFYPHGPKHYGIGIFRCEETGGKTITIRTSHEREVNGRGRRVCEHCATPSERESSRNYPVRVEGRVPCPARDRLGAAL